MSMVKVILFSQIPLPYSQIGSWSTLYDNYLKQYNGIDVIICPKPDKKYPNISYEYFSRTNLTIHKVIQKTKFRTPWHQAISALKKVIAPNSKYIIHIVDNYGLCMAVARYLEKENCRNNFFIHYFYHGFQTFKNEILYSKVDELTLLTHKSYQEIKSKANVFPCRVSVLHNGIDTSIFYSVSKEEKQKLRKKLNVKSNKIFIWCSQERPKKGLHIILDVWRNLTKHHNNIELWIVGTAQKQNTENIKYIGRVPNTELAKYYQASDVYLFPTLCQEGFGMSLIEAKHSGCYCIASALGGVPEVLQNGKYGKLIENPNFVEEWIKAIEDYLKEDYENISFPKDLYTKESWNIAMENSINNTKVHME